MHFLSSVFATKNIILVSEIVIFVIRIILSLIDIILNHSQTTIVIIIIIIVIMTNTITIIIIGVSIVSIKTIANITTILFPPEQTPHPGHSLDNARQLGIQQIVRNVQPEMKMQSIWCRNKCDHCGYTLS